MNFSGSTLALFEFLANRFHETQLGLGNHSQWCKPELTPTLWGYIPLVKLLPAPAGVGQCVGSLAEQIESCSLIRMAEADNCLALSVKQYGLLALIILLSV